MPSPAPLPSLRDHLGNEVRLATKPFAVGGEGAVYDVQGRPDLVAKIYTKAQSQERCDKLRAMAALCSPDLLKIAAWPTATLSSGRGAAVDGILMPKVAGFQEIHHLYSVAQRKKDFPKADWGFLIHTARNCASAFESVHRHGHVVGDVNQKNVMVSAKGIVAFVDCDSFQIAEGSRIYRCGVGVPEYTPPELHGKNFGGLDRSSNHDLFGLAVLVFHLLMMGRHPYAGVPRINADVPIEKAILEGDYAYTRNAAQSRLKPPPHSPPVTILDPTLLDLFEQAFSTTQRPTAAAWRTALDATMKGLTRCKNDARHAYLAGSAGCPWCVLIATARLLYFLPSQARPSVPPNPEEIQSLARILASLTLGNAPYSRPKPSSPLRVSLPPGLRAPTPKPMALPQPPPPVHPPLQQPGPPDPFLPRLCMIGVVLGLCTLPFAWPVGVLTALLCAWSGVAFKAIAKRANKAEAAEREAAHWLDCKLMDAEFEHARREVDAENARRNAAWEAANPVWSAEEKKWLTLGNSVEAKLKRLEAEFASQLAAGCREFEKKKREADEIVVSYQKASQEYNQELRRAERDARRHQLEEYLDRHLIRDAKLKSITGARILSLESFGVQTANDVAMLQSLKVPGIGPVLTERLVDWRTGLEGRFTPRQTLPEAEKNKIDARYSPVMTPMHEGLSNVIRDLKSLIAAHKSTEKAQMASIGASVQKDAIVKAHLAALNALP